MYIDTKSRTLKGQILYMDLDEGHDHWQGRNWEVGDITNRIISTEQGLLTVIEEMGVSMVNYQNQYVGSVASPTTLKQVFTREYWNYEVLWIMNWVVNLPSQLQQNDYVKAYNKLNVNEH
mgnify:CR=1 FL=1